MTKSQFSHAILYVDVSCIIDSDGYGVRSNNIQRLLIEKEEDAAVLRLKNKNKMAIKKAEMFAREKIGTEYSVEEAKLAMLYKELSAKEPNRQFCTRFVAQAYESAGVKLVENSNYCTPEELLISEHLEKIENVLRPAHPKEIEFAKSKNPMDKQTEIHNKIFSKARELSGDDIQTFDQVNLMIIKKPQIDQEFTEFVTNTGYSTFIEEDMEANPWDYDSSKMIEHYKNQEQLLEAAMYFSSTEEKTRERLLLTIDALIHLDKTFPRYYFKTEIALYKKIIKYSLIRETEALKVLSLFK